MMLLVDVRRLARSVLEGSSQWSDSLLDRWIGDGIRLYSAEFPRRWRHVITLVTGQQAYALPGGHGLQEVLSVRYPASDGAALARAAEESAAFENGGEAYALRAVGDDTAGDEDTGTGEIVFAQAVTTGETAVLEYLGSHRSPVIGDDDAVITVPEGHMEAILAFVEFRAQRQLEVGEATEMLGDEFVIGSMGVMARWAWNRYRQVMEHLAQAGVSGGGRAVSWGDYGL